MKYTFLLPFTLLFINGFGQDFTPNYDESKIPEYELPALLSSKNGDKVQTSAQWEKSRRKEILSDFEEYVYGKIPKGKVKIKTELIKEMDAFNGKATMKEVKMIFTKNDQSISMDILIYLPKSHVKVPTFVGLNFKGNHAIIDDPKITLTKNWIENDADLHITNNKATEASRGVRHYRWPVETIIDRGYGLATIFIGDIDPDKNDLSDGIHALFYKSGQIQPAKDEWGAISAWAWGLSRAMDYFEEDDDIDESKIALMGHSRLGKTSLWAGALDRRFAIVISNDSGCGGAALSRRRIGETVWRINTSFPYWFSDNFNEFNNNEDALPVDQHMLIALVAPRPVYVASAQDDQWADPRGEFLSAYHAGEVYQLFGLKGLPNIEMPKVNEPIMKSVGYHIRTGKHGVIDFDWEAWMDFADMHFGK
ncbi:MAG: acetylxylan esterase [Cyclobacteriaceae bacterium]|nr:acetylxylan esterase [Cyclobacteriaceae bacterium]